MATVETEKMLSDQRVLIILQGNLETLRENKPDDRSERDRRYAITITEMEKVVAYFKTWVK